MRTIKIEQQIWKTAGAFTIARSSINEIVVVRVTISEGGFVGRGECRPYARYQETPESVTGQIHTITEELKNGLDNEGLQDKLPAGAARNAVDCALWDLRCKQEDCSIWEILGLAQPMPRITAYTLSLNTPEKMARAAIKAQDYPLLKLKIGQTGGLEACLAVLRARPDAKLIIDANEALEPEALPKFRAALADKPVVLIEQPVPAALYDHIENAPEALPILCADESLHTRKDLPGLWQAGYRAVNVKLDKCGGLTEGVALMRQAKSMGFVIMAGCMVGTSLAMAPIMALSGFSDVIDLDGPLLLAEDVPQGLNYSGPVIAPPTAKLWG